MKEKTQEDLAAYECEFVICRKAFTVNMFLESAASLEEAERKAKKYAHLHEVVIEERFTRIVKTFPKIPVCI